MAQRKYKCNKCGEIVSRRSVAGWIKSVCGKTGQWSRLIPVDKIAKRSVPNA